MINLLLLLI